MNEPTQNPKPIQAARRKLVRGAFAVPAVITLASGGPAAATSLTCVQKQHADPMYPTNGQVPDGTDLVRIPYYKQSSGSKYYIKGSDAHDRVFPGKMMKITNFTTRSGWQEILISYGHATCGSARYTNPWLSGTPSGHVVVRYDAEGNVVGIGKGTTGTAVGGSCWVSINAGGH